MDENRSIPKGISHVTAFVTLYDIFGYLTPGFCFLLGLYFLFYNFCNASRIYYFISPILDNYYGIVGVIIASYILGHLLSRISKIIERLPDFLEVIFKGRSPVKRFTEYLFEGPEKNPFVFKRRISDILLNRFYLNYSKLILASAGKTDSTSTEEVRDLLATRRIKPGDFIWDASNALMSVAPEQFNRFYVFLSLSGFFRTITVVWVFLLIAAFKIKAITGFTGLIYFKDLYWVLAGLIVFSWISYIKFGRMHSYDAIRSFANLRIK